MKTSTSKGASQSSQVATDEGTMVNGSETLGAEEGIDQKLWSECCR
jgi:hypothetical protein